MAIPPRLHRKLQETLGAEAASDLVGVLVSMDESRADIRGDIRELRHEMQLGFARIDARFAELRGEFGSALEKGRGEFGSALEKGRGEFGSAIEKVRGEFATALEKGLRDQTRFFFLAWAVLLAAIIGLYART